MPTLPQSPLEADLPDFLSAELQAKLTPIGSAPPAASKPGYDPTRRARELAAQHELQEAMDNCVKRLLLTQGSKYAGLNMTATAKVTAKRSSDNAPAYTDIVAMILSSKGPALNAAEIRREVQHRHPGMTVPKDWNRALPSWAVKQIKSRAQGSGAPFDTIEFPSRLTLNQLHARAQSAWAKTKEGSIERRVSVEVTKEALVIAGHRFKFSENKSGGRIYPTARITVDAAINALQAGVDR